MNREVCEHFKPIGQTCKECEAISMPKNDQYAKGFADAVEEVIFYVAESLFDPETADKIDERFNGAGV